MDYSDKNEFINFSKDIDEQLYKLFKISPVEQKHIEDVLAKKTE